MNRENGGSPETRAVRLEIPEDLWELADEVKQRTGDTWASLLAAGVESRLDGLPGLLDRKGED